VDDDRRDDQDDQRADAVDRADPPVGIREEDLHGADDREQKSPADVGSRQPGDECRDQDGELEVVHDPAGVLMLVQRVRAEQLPCGQIDLEEHAEDDETRRDKVKPVEDTPKGLHG
jgi:hypothetical protein